MRTTLILLVILLALSVPAGAVKLQTSATVQLIESTNAHLDHWNANSRPAWTVTGAPDERLQVSLELQTADGRRVTLDRGEHLDLGHDGRVLTTLTAPPTSPHETIDVVTLVICRE